MSGRRAQQDTEKSARGILHYLGVGISAGLLAFVILLGVLVIVIPAIAGATPLTVLTSSMEPKLPPGTLVIVKPVDHTQIEVGDVITYQIESGKEALVTHRVTAITNSSDGERTFTTKGDNNDLEDGNQVLAVQIKGKVWYSVPWIGYINTLATGNMRGWIIPAIAVALFAYAGYMLASGIATSARKRRRGADSGGEPA